MLCRIIKKWYFCKIKRLAIPKKDDYETCLDANGNNRLGIGSLLDNNWKSSNIHILNSINYVVNQFIDW